MPKPDDPSSRWVQTEAAKHITPASVRRRIADEQQQIRILVDAGLVSGDMPKALEAHHELIRGSRWIDTHGQDKVAVFASAIEALVSAIVSKEKGPGVPRALSVADLRIVSHQTIQHHATGQNE